MGHVIVVEDLVLQAGSCSLGRVSLTFSEGYAVLMGRTGCGKTTLLETIAGLRRSSGGRVLLNGRNVTRLPPGERDVGYVPQDLALFPTLTVHEHLALGPYVRGWPAREVKARVTELAQLLGITHLLQRRPHGLSGGEGQRVALGRALSFRPAILLLDEPLSALDEETRREMYNLLRLVQRQTQVSALHITHSEAEAEALADVRFRFHEGQVRRLD